VSKLQNENNVTARNAAFATVRSSAVMCFILHLIGTFHRARA
jgi:hypothetical protein